MSAFFEPWQSHEVVRVHRGDAPLIVSLPHDGYALPDDIRATMVDAARHSPDTDWHVSRLYAFAIELGATLLRPRYSRYVIDLNRPPDGAPLYPGRNETGLCPLSMFDGQPIYVRGHEPSPSSVAQRIEHYWRPYHNRLQAEMERLRAQHSEIVLWEGHSIRSECPMFFEGVLPDYNLGTADGASCRDEVLRPLIVELELRQRRFVANGRFKGGHITRHYGNPSQGVNAVQMEMAQSRYLDESEPSIFQPPLARQASDDLCRLLQIAIDTVTKARPRRS